jgi:diphthamide synthase (EF-2-diphthine--ammonia ligase)
MGSAMKRAREEGITHIAFGDLFLEDIRDYRIRQLAGSGIEPVFPVWTGPDGTAALARQMLDAGLAAILTCVDPARLDPSFAGRRFDAQVLDEFPPSVDPLGERGEFHTVCVAGPMFEREIPVTVGLPEEHGDFWYADVMPN